MKNPENQKEIPQEKPHSYLASVGIDREEGS